MIEVADTSLNYDHAVKRALYARHAIQELWMLILQPGKLKSARSPEADGYAATVRVGQDGELEPQLLPGVRIQAAALFR